MLVDLGLELRAKIEMLQADLDIVERAIISYAAEGEMIDLVDEDREGRQFLAKGGEAVVPVVFTADKLVASFKDRSELHNMLEGWVGSTVLCKFYRRITSWEMIPKGGKPFRKLAGELLGNADGPALVTACLARDKHGIPKSDIKVEWKRAEKINK
jgi:hypothetical protein